MCGSPARVTSPKASSTFAPTLCCPTPMPHPTRSLHGLMQMKHCCEKKAKMMNLSDDDYGHYIMALKDEKPTVIINNKKN